MSVLFGRVREQGDRSRALEGSRERTLVAGAGACNPSRQDLAAVAHKAAEARDLLVIDVVDLLDAEAADLAVLALRPPSRAVTWWAVYCHGSLLERDLVRVDIARRVVRGGYVFVDCGGAVSNAGPACGSGRGGRSGRAAGLEELNIVGG